MTSGFINDAGHNVDLIHEVVENDYKVARQHGATTAHLYNVVGFIELCNEEESPATMLYVTDHIISVRHAMSTLDEILNRYKISVDKYKINAGIMIVGNTRIIFRPVDTVINGVGIKGHHIDNVEIDLAGAYGQDTYREIWHSVRCQMV